MNAVRRCCLLLAFLSLPSGLTVAARAAPDPMLIVPGQSLGPVRLGAPVLTLQQMPDWGPPDHTHASGTISYLTYARHRVTVATRDGQIVMVLTSSDRFRTERGLAVGQPAAAATTAYGTPASGGDSRHLWFDAIGLVVVTGAGTIIRIGVYDPRTFVRAILSDEVPARDVLLTARAPAYATAAAGDGQPPIRAAIIAVTLRNMSRGAKVLNPNFFTLIDREGKAYRYDRSTLARRDACRSTVTVRPGESGSCALVFVLPTGRSPRSIMFNDGGSADEFFFP